MKPGVRPRVVAARLVGRVVRGGAWSNVVVRELDLSREDSALVRYLVYGTLRNLARLDRAVEQLSHRPLSTIEPALLDVLRVAFQEVLFGRAADHAVAHTAVESARISGHPRGVGFVNALVRALQRQGEPSPPAGISGIFSLADWIVEDLVSTLGEASARAFAEAAHRDARVTFRMQAGGTPPPGAVPIAVEGAYFDPHGRVPGGAVVQDPASLAVVRAVQVDARDRVLEVGAAPGGKTMALRDEDPGHLVAVDIHQRRIRRAQRRTAGSGSGVRWVRADGGRLPFGAATFDRVLVDAPCTGLGTLRRRPEIRFRASPGDRDRLAALQRRMVEEGLRVVRPGGRVVYAVCTLTAAETTGVVSGLDGRPPDGLPGLRIQDGLFMAPHLTDTDGMFISVLGR